MWSKRRCRTLLLHAPSQTAGSHHKNLPSNSTTDVKQATVPYAPAARSLTNSRKSSQKLTVKQHHWCEASDGAVRSCSTLPHKQQEVITKTYRQTAPLMWSRRRCRTLLLHAPSQTAGGHRTRWGGRREKPRPGTWAWRKGSPSGPANVLLVCLVWHKFFFIVDV